MAESLINTNTIMPDHPDMRVFLRHCHMRNYPAKYTLINPGEKGETLFYLAEGSISISMTDPSGHEIILAYVNKGEFIGEAGAFLGSKVHFITARTRQPCLLAEISYQRFHQLLQAELAPHAVGILLVMAKQLAERLLNTDHKVGDLAFKTAAKRITHALFTLCKQPDAITHPDGMLIRITRQELGCIVGCSRELVGRILKDLQARKLISVEGKSIVVFGIFNHYSTPGHTKHYAA